MKALTSDTSPIIAPSLGVGWGRCLATILDRGQVVRDEERLLTEVCNLVVEFTAIAEDDPAIQAWANSARIDLMKLKYESCDIVANYRISYGKLIYDNNGINQLEWVIQRLQHKRETKSATIALHRPGEDDLSCLSLLDFKVRAGSLSMTAVYRSQNVLASQPGNLIALRRIQLRVAEGVSAKVGSLHLVLCSAHIYDEDLMEAQRVVAATRALWERRKSSPSQSLLHRVV